MDRIQKALDKAKAKQQVNTVDERDLPAKNVVSPVKKVIKETVDIAYTQTKVVSVSEETLANKRIIAGQYSNPQSGVFRMLRTQVLQKMHANNWQTIAVTSPTAGEGKSLVASNLAVAMAMETNQTVLLVDLDLRNPRLNDYFSLNAELGLKDYLEGDMELAEVLFNPGLKGLVVLPGKGRAENSAELLSSTKMTNLAANLKKQYDSRLIIFDMPPILQTDDVLLASKYIDCALLVIEDGKNKESEITKSLQLLGSTKLIGSVLNKSEKPPVHQSY
jgi:protein-tyrosine kinase|tara:strand:- start:25983 stop:26810 length:828 start_codon:yes stop_codon:yes gene_type:complete